MEATVAPHCEPMAETILLDELQQSRKNLICTLDYLFSRRAFHLSPGKFVALKSSSAIQEILSCLGYRKS